MKQKILFVTSDADGANLPRHFLSLFQNEDYEYSLLSLKGEIKDPVPNMKIRTLTESSYLDVPFWQGLKKCVKKKIWSYLFILLWEKIRKKRDMKMRLAHLKPEGRFDACISLDMESTSFVANNVTARKKILRFTQSRVTEPYEEDCKALEKFDSAVILNEKIKDAFAKTYTFDPENIVYIPNIPDYGTIKEKADAEMPEKKADVSLTSFCRLASVKQLSFAKSISRKLIEKGFKNFVWNIAGGCENTVKTELELAEKGQDRYINFMKKAENPFPYMKNCDIYVHISDLDGDSASLEYAGIFAKPYVSLMTERNRSVSENMKGFVLEAAAEKFAEKIIYIYNNRKDFGYEPRLKTPQSVTDAYEKLFTETE